MVRPFRLILPAAVLVIAGFVLVVASTAFVKGPPVFVKGSPAAAATPPAPTNLRQVSSTDTSVKMAWDADASATKFEVSAALDSGFTEATTKQSGSKDATVTGLIANRTYYVRVRELLPVASDWSTVATATTAQLINVGSFNIKAQNNSGSCQSWSTRKSVVAKQIVDEKLDVVGLQEALYDNNRQGLLDALTKAGGSYGMTYLPTTKTGSGNRLLYNTKRVKLIGPSFDKFDDQEHGDERSVIWATFELVANKQRFIVFTSHLAPGASASLTKSQWSEVLADAKQYGAKLPTIITGDFNTSKFNKPADSMLPAMNNGGFGDVLGQTYKSYTVSGQRAVTKTNAWINSYNDCKRSVSGVDPANIGNNIDWIFASNSLKVPKWKTVAPRSGSTLTTPIASDHFMITAKFLIPIP